MRGFVQGAFLLLVLIAFFNVFFAVSISRQKPPPPLQQRAEPLVRAELVISPLASPLKPQPVENSLGMQLILIPPGEFTMGDQKAGDFDESPAHRVRISRGFFLGAHEVTQGSYRKVMKENPSWFSPDGPGREEVRDVDTDRLPVDMLSWQEAVEFCRVLSELPAEQEAGRTYRLPTEAEWEYACRAGTTSAYSFGAELDVSQACIANKSSESPSRTVPVGSFQPNDFGLYDMHGNVWEWCADWYDPESYDRTPKGQIAVDPRGPAEGTGRVVRGGSFRFGSDYARSSNRDFTRATRRDLGNGFRVVCEMK